MYSVHTPYLFLCKLLNNSRLCSSVLVHTVQRFQRLMPIGRAYPYLLTELRLHAACPMQQSIYFKKMESLHPKKKEEKKNLSQSG